MKRTKARTCAMRKRESGQVFEIGGGIANCITSVQKDSMYIGKVMEEKIGVKQATKQGYIPMKVGGVVDLSYPTSEFRRGRVQGGGDVSPTITTEIWISKVLGKEQIKLANVEDYLYKGFGVFKLSPRECGRLMGVKDTDIDKMFYEIKEWKGEDLLCNAKSKDATEKLKLSDTGIYVLCTTKELKGTEQRNLCGTLNQKKESIQNVNIVIERLAGSAHSECAIDITKCLESTEMLCTLTKELEQHRTAILGLAKQGKENTEKYMKITLGENLDRKKLYTILTLIKLITESKIFTSTIRKVNIRGCIANTEDCGNNMERTLISDLRMVATYTRVSSSQCYKQFGNSIAVPVLMALFSQLGLPGVKKWNDMTEEERKALVAENMDFLKGDET